MCVSLQCLLWWCQPRIIIITTVNTEREQSCFRRQRVSYLLVNYSTQRPWNLLSLRQSQHHISVLFMLGNLGLSFIAFFQTSAYVLLEFVCLHIILVFFLNNRWLTVSQVCLSCLLLSQHDRPSSLSFQKNDDVRCMRSCLHVIAFFSSTSVCTLAFFDLHDGCCRARHIITLSWDENISPLSDLYIFFIKSLSLRYSWGSFLCHFSFFSTSKVRLIRNALWIHCVLKGWCSFFVVVLTLILLLKFLLLFPR